MLLPIIAIASALIASAVPILFVSMRESTKHHRQGIIKDLSLVFGTRDPSGQIVIPSFEFVKYKYYLGKKNDDQDAKRDFKLHHWILSGIPLAITLCTLNCFCTVVVLHKVVGIDFSLAVDWLSGSAPLPLFSWVILASYTGATIFMLRAFFQAINNFDLSPLSFMGATVNLVTGVSSGLLVIFGVLRVTESLHVLDLSNPSLFPVVLLTAYAAGYVPDLALRNITRLSSLRGYKREDSKIYENFKATPIEIIDGIDIEIRSRLIDYHIACVQNLAAANPLMLFVETPYGVYQIMDWVAQAQLCCSVGSEVLQKFWALGIRTIFDLERVALDPMCNAPELIEQIGCIIWQDLQGDANGVVRYPSKEAIQADIRFRLESPHVHRLRQIFNQVGESLGSEARRLPPVVDCLPGGNCPFVRPAAPQRRAKRPARHSWRFVFHRV